MTDNGLAALAAALHALHCGDLIHSAYRHDHDDDAAAILGERGVFLPDGLPHLGTVEHGYTCGVCPWGRADQPRSLADYVEHMNAEHPTGPLLEGDAG